jgi:hypothetical protein
LVSHQQLPPPPPLELFLQQPEWQQHKLLQGQARLPALFPQAETRLACALWMRRLRVLLLCLGQRTLLAWLVHSFSLD